MRLRETEVVALRVVGFRGCGVSGSELCGVEGSRIWFNGWGGGYLGF